MSGLRRLRSAPAINAGAITLCASLIVLALAVHVIGRFRGQAEEARQAQLLLEETKAHLMELDGLAWRARAVGRLNGSLEQRVAVTRAAARETLVRLEDYPGTEDTGLPSAFEEFARAQDDEFDAMEGGGITRAAAVGRGRQDPTFESLNALIDHHTLASAATVADANGLATTGVTVTVLLSALAIALLYRSFRSVRHDMDLAQEHRKAVEASESRFRALVQNSADVIGIIDENGILTYISSTVRRVMGYEPSDLIGSSGFTYIHPEDIEAGQDTLLKLVMEPESSTEVELRMLHADGSWRWTEVSGRNLLSDPKIKGVLINYRDITDKKELENQLRELAFTDALTSLANRTLFVDRVDHALARRERTAAPLTVLFLDVDDFKTINDSLGHACGDALLSEIARRLQRCLRPEDTIARLGGDEFAILLEDADAPSSRNVAQRILEHVRRPILLGDRESVVTISIGIADAVYARDSDQLLRNADVAMYMAKGRGKARFDVFEPSMHEAAVKRMELKGDLQNALDRGEFYLDYQPTVDLQTGGITGVEALARWRHPTQGVVSPGDFIPLAEESGMIFPIGRWVLREACAQLQRWREGRPDLRELTVNVNISARQLSSETLMVELADVLSETLTPPENLTLEITESLMMEDADTTIETFSKLKTLGVKIAIDDFGTGYSALSYLRRFPVDVLKIDKEFVDEVTGGDEQSALVQAIIRLANSFGLQTVAEGIEEADQVGALQRLGCHLGQGHYFARPSTPEAVETLLVEKADLVGRVAAARAGDEVLARTT